MFIKSSWHTGISLILSVLFEITNFKKEKNLSLIFSRRYNFSPRINDKFSRDARVIKKYLIIYFRFIIYRLYALFIYLRSRIDNRALTSELPHNVRKPGGIFLFFSDKSRRDRGFFSL